MFFNSLDFIIFFLIVLTSLVIIKNRKYQHLILLVASYFFFYYTSNYLIILLIFSTVLDFYVGQAIWKAKSIVHKKGLLIISLAGNLGLLGFFKYSDFAISQFNVLGSILGFEEIPLLNIILPIGISFYTFQTISYTIDIYRGGLTPCKSLKEFALFVAFFPSLVAGPIIRAKQFLPQLREQIDNLTSNSKLRQIVFQGSNLKLGITLMAFGFFKKMFFADNIAPMVNDVFSSTTGLESLTIILGTIGFGIQVYGDFSGYSDIAIGAALIIGIKIPMNFNKPFFATSPGDFWNRWHISLSSWVRDYLYLPLVFKNKRSNPRIFASILLSMTLIGLWHGAGWNWLIFGLMHGFYVGIHRILRNYIPMVKINKFFKTKIGTVIAIFVTQYLVFLSFLVFRVNDLDALWYSISKFILLDFQMNETISFISSHKLPVLLIGLFILLHYISYRKKNLPEIISSFKWKHWILFLLVITLTILFFYDSNPQQFIYFQF